VHIREICQIHRWGEFELALVGPMYAPFWPVDGLTSVKADPSQHRYRSTQASDVA